MRVSLLLYLLIVSISALGGNPPLESKGDPSKGHLTSFSAEVVDPSLNDEEPWNPELSDGKFKQLDENSKNRPGSGIRDEDVISSPRFSRNVASALVELCKNIETPVLFELLTRCKGRTVLTKDEKDVLKITNIGDNELSQILTTDGKLLFYNNFAIENTQISKLHIQMSRTHRAIKLKIVNNLKLRTITIDVQNEDFEGEIEIVGNPLLEEDILKNIEEQSKSGKFKKVYLQNFGECFFDRPPKSFAELKDCRYYYGDLTIDGTTEISDQFPQSFENVTGCINIKETNLTDISFVHGLTVNCDNDRKNNISFNSELCLKPQQKRNILNHLGQNTILENKKFSHDCEATCSPEYLKEKEDNTCTIIEGVLKMENYDENPYKSYDLLSNIEEIRGSLVFIRGSMTTLNIAKLFPSLKTINATQKKDYALRIVQNKNLKNVVFPETLYILEVDATQKKIYMADNGKYEMDDNLRKRLETEYGSEYLLIVGEALTSLGTDVLADRGNATSRKSKNNDSKTKEQEEKENTNGIIGGVVGVIMVFILIVIAAAVGIYFWKKNKKKNAKEAQEKKEEEEGLQRENKEREEEEKEAERKAQELKEKKAMKARQFFGALYVSLMPTVRAKPFDFFTEPEPKKDKERWIRNQELMKKDRAARREKAAKNGENLPENQRLLQIIEDESEIKSEVEVKSQVTQMDDNASKIHMEKKFAKEETDNKEIKRETAGTDATEIERETAGKDKQKNSKNQKKRPLTKEEAMEKISKIESELKALEESKEDSVAIHPLIIHTGNKKFLQLVTEKKVDIINTKMDMELNEKISEWKRAYDDYVLPSESNDLVNLEPPLLVVDGEKQRGPRAIIDHKNKYTTYPFVSQVDKEKKKMNNTWPDETLPIYEQPYKYTLERMQFLPEESFEEHRRFNNDFNIEDAFDIVPPKQENIAFAYCAKKESSADNHLIEAPEISINKFEHTKRNGTGENGDLTLTTEVKWVPTTDTGFLNSVVMAYLSIEMDRWLFLTADEYLFICKKALRSVDKGKTALCTRFRFSGRIIGEFRGKFADLRKALLLSWADTEGSDMKYDHVFLGNYLGYEVTNVDTIGLLFALKALRGENVTLLRGLTEWREIQEKLEFRKELEHRFGKRANEIFDAINDVFDYLPLACKLEPNKLCLYGGLAPNMTKLNTTKLPIRELKRDTLPYNLMFALPNYTVNRYTKNGDNGYYFGEQQLIEEGKLFNFDTLFVSKPLTTGWGQFGVDPVVFLLSSGMNLEGNSVKLKSAVADIALCSKGSEECKKDYEYTYIKVIYQDHEDEKQFATISPDKPDAIDSKHTETENKLKDPLVPNDNNKALDQSLANPSEVNEKNPKKTKKPESVEKMVPVMAKNTTKRKVKPSNRTVADRPIEETKRMKEEAKEKNGGKTPPIKRKKK